MTDLRDDGTAGQPAPSMTNPDELEALAGRVEREPFQGLSRELLLEIFHTARPRSSFDSGRDCDRARRAFVSLWEVGGALDAAMMLVPEALYLSLEQHSASYTATLANRLWFDDSRIFWDANAATPALALCAAALRASTPTQTQKGPHDE